MTTFNLMQDEFSSGKYDYLELSILSGRLELGDHTTDKIQNLDPPYSELVWNRSSTLAAYNDGFYQILSAKLHCSKRSSEVTN